MTTAVSEQTGAWLAAFTGQKPAAPWVQELRNAAFRRFAELGFPTTKNEEWRFTNVAPIARAAIAPALGAANIAEEAQAQLAKHAGIDRNAFVALNTAFLDQVGFFRVPRGEVRKEPIQISHESAQAGSLLQATHPRSLIVVGADAQCTIIETYHGTGRYF